MNPYALYLHVPYCRSRCDYCAFHSRPSWTRGDAETMVAKLIAEIETLRDVLARVETLFIGGGTPSVLPGRLIADLVNAAHRAAPQLREVTVEANPESCTADFLHRLSEAGVDRLSVGVQTLEHAAARAIGRRLTSRDELERLRRAWPGRLAFDLIHAAPGSTTSGFMRALDFLVAIGAEHLSVYGLTVEAGTPLAARMALDTPTPPEANDWPDVVSRLSRHGLRRYEVSNFARPGAECEHNLAYWRGREYIGLGPSAVSTVTFESCIVRLTAPSDHARYLARENPLEAVREVLSPRDAQFERVMLGLRTREGIPASLLDESTEWDTSAVERLCVEGLLVRRGGRVAATDRGMDLLDHLLRHL